MKNIHKEKNKCNETQENINNNNNNKKFTRKSGLQKKP